MSVEDEVFAYLQRVLTDLSKEAKDGGPRQGTPPCSFDVEHKEPCGEPHKPNTGLVKRRWRLTATDIAPRPIEAEPADRGVSGMYYEVGYADFSITGSEAAVQVGWWAGPRYGRGVRLAIEAEADGTTRLRELPGGWFS